MDLIAEIRRHLVRPESISSIARDLKLCRQTVRRHCRTEAKPSYQRSQHPAPMPGRSSRRWKPGCGPNARERLGKSHLTPAQGASAELVGAVRIGTAGFTGLPVSTTHIITSGIAGTMVGSGAGINPSMLTRIALAWAFTMPITITSAAALFYTLAPK